MATRVGEIPAVVTNVGGRAGLAGISHYGTDPDGPFPEGYRLNDRWFSVGLSLKLAEEVLLRPFPSALVGNCGGGSEESLGWPLAGIVLWNYSSLCSTFDVLANCLLPPHNALCTKSGAASFAELNLLSQRDEVYERQ
jgi:hypothetical protein